MQPSVKMEWTAEKTTELIELYRQNEILWNHSLSDFKNHTEKIYCLTAISERLGCNVTELRKKIKNLRTQFHREHKIFTSTEPGQTAATKKKWEFYRPLYFILNGETPPEGAWSDNNAQGENNEHSGKISDIPDEASESDRSLSSIPSSSKNTPLRKRKRQTATIVNKQRAEKSYHTLKTSNAKDEFTIYGEYVASELRKLRHKTQLMAKHEINSLLFHAALSDLEPEVGSRVQRESRSTVHREADEVPMSRSEGPEDELVEFGKSVIGKFTLA